MSVSRREIQLGLDKARLRYERAATRYLKALKASKEEMNEAIDQAAENISDFKPSDFVGMTFTWEEIVADTLKELRIMKDQDEWTGKEKK
jgi:hypothetical protein